MILLLTILNTLAFIIYGVLCLTTDSMMNEFERYGLLKFRTLTGYLEVLGGLGCIVGYYFNNYLNLAACLGLALLMTAGVIIRVRVGDPFIQTIPAIALGVINYYLFYKKVT